MSYFLGNWGSFVGVLGVVISLGGFFIAIRRATQARSAAAAAQEASQETRAAMTQTMAVVDLQRAIALVQRLKVLHRDDNWEASLEHYQPLRAMLSDINGRHQLPRPEQHTLLREAVPQIQVMEDTLARALREGMDPAQQADYDQVLNAIQVSLERIASESYFPEGEAGR